jgi:hypothetical protein
VLNGILSDIVVERSEIGHLNDLHELARMNFPFVDFFIGRQRIELLVNDSEYEDFKDRFHVDFAMLVNLASLKLWHARKGNDVRVDNWHLH